MITNDEVFVPIDYCSIQVTSPGLLSLCQKKFVTQEISFTPAQVYIVMMEISPTYTIAERGPGRLIWQSINQSLTYESFKSSDAGLFAKIAIMLKRAVMVRPSLSTIYDATTKEGTQICILERLMACCGYDGAPSEWQIDFCFPNFEVRSKRGTLSEICTIFKSRN